MGFPEQLLGSRVEEFFLEVLDKDENSIGWLSKWSDGSIQKNYDATIQSGFQVTLDEIKEDWFDLSLIRFRPWQRVNEMQWPLGVYLPSKMSKAVSEGGVRLKVTAVDKVSILDSTSITSTYSIAAKSNIVDAVRALFNFTQEDNVVVTPSPKLTTELMVWPAGTSILKIMNELLGKINYAWVWVDRFGQFRIEPDIDLNTAPVVHEFRRGAVAIHSVDYEETQDYLTVPNRVICMTQGSAEEPALIGTYTNTDPNSPYSVQARGGRVIDKVYQVEAADQKTIDSKARSYLQSSLTPPRYLNVKHASLPLDLKTVVTFSDLGTPECKAWINEFSQDLKVGAPMTGRWIILDGETISGYNLDTE